MSVLGSQNVKKTSNSKKFIFLGVVILIIVVFFVLQKKDVNIKNEVEKTPITSPSNPLKGKLKAENSLKTPPSPSNPLKGKLDAEENIYSKQLKASIRYIEERPDLITIEDEVKKEPLATTLHKLSLDHAEVYLLTKSMTAGGYDFTKTRPGEKFIVKTDDKGKIWEFYIFPSKLTYYYTFIDDNKKLKTTKLEKVLKDEVRLVKGEIKYSLSESMEELGEHPNLVIQLADFVFKGGEIDFFSDCQKGDKFAIKVARKYYLNMKGEKVFTNQYSDIEAVYYKGSTVGDVYAFKFSEKKNQLPDYYNEEAKAVKRPFLRVPFTFRVGVSSGFGMRRDPVSRAFTRNHNGTDFPVKTGTPFISPAKGRIIKMGYQKNGAGRWFRVRHANGYFTEYFHLSKIKKGLRVGSVVKQGEVLGKTGNTGRSTGAHLHYGMMRACKKCRKGFKYVNAMRQKFNISIKPMPSDKKPAYLKMMKPLKKELDKAIKSI